MFRVAALLLVGASLLSGCQAAKFQPVVRTLEHEPNGVCTPSSGPPSDAALGESAALARDLSDNILAALSNEFPEKHRQFIARLREPLQRFPRLTFPAMVDPEPASGARDSDAWFFPLVIDKRQLGDIPVAAMPGELRFWLVPHGTGVDPATWRDVTECLVRGSDRGTIFAADRDRSADLRPAGAIVPTLARPERLRGVVFEIPTRTAAGAAVAPGFYDLRILPRLNALGEATVRNPKLRKIKQALEHGDWPRALEAARQLGPGDLNAPQDTEDLRAMARRVAPASNWVWTLHPSPNFDVDLRELRDGLNGLAKQLENDPGHIGAVKLSLSRLERPLLTTVVARQSVAPVSLKDPKQEVGRCGGRDCLRIAVGGDFQYHANLGPLRRFLGMLDPDFVDASGAGSDAPASDAAVPDVDFVLFAGDLADAAAGSAKEQLLLNVLGLLPPKSPYGEDGGNEMPEIRDQLAHFQKPFFAVPGNHDGYAGYGGILNVLVDELGFLTEEAFVQFRAPRMGRSAGNAIKGVNNIIPSFVGWRLLNRLPRYDGLGEYQSYLGPLNLAFKFRGHSFVGLNSYDLDARERASVGGVILYWGGGVQDESVLWMDDMLERFAPDPVSEGRGREQVVFMHHDPRAAVPTKSGYSEQQFGRYDAIDTPVSQLTMGHAGLGNSPDTGLYLPIVSFAATFIWRNAEISLAGTGSWQQVWMRQTDWGAPSLPDIGWPVFFDREGYNAKGLIDVLNCNLAGRSGPAKAAIPFRDGVLCQKPRGNVSEILFAHDNVPVDTLWADPEERRAVFREPTSGWTWRSRELTLPTQFGSAVLGLKYRNGTPPDWAKHMRLDENEGNARVLRMDDVGDDGNYHGFHVLTLYADGETEPETQWYALPR